MALPFTFTGAAWCDWKNSSIGPFEVSGVLWAPILGSAQVDMWKSTDGGVNWTKVSSGPSTSITANSRTFAACLDGTQIAIVYMTTPTVVGCARYNTVGQSWTTISTTTGPLTDVTGKVPLAVVCRGSNNYVAAYASASEAVMGTSYRRISVRPWTTSGWGTAAVVETGAAQHHDLVGLVAGSSSRTHTFYRSGVVAAQNDIKQRSFLSGNTFGTAQAAATAVFNGTGYAGGVPASYISGANTQVMLPAADSSTTVLSMVRFVSADSPTYTVETVTATNGPETSTANPGAAVTDGSTTAYVFWPDASADDLWYDNDSGSGTWGTDVQQRSGITVQGVNASSVTNGIGVLYSDSGAVTYDFLSLSAATLSLVMLPPARRRQHRIAR